MKKPARATKAVARNQALANEKDSQFKRRIVSSPWSKIGVAICVVTAMVVGVGIATAKDDDSPLKQVLNQVVPVNNNTEVLAALPNAAASAGSKAYSEPARETIDRCVAGHYESASCKENARLNDGWNKLSVQEKMKDPSTMARLNAANTAHWQTHGVTLPGAEYYDQIQKERAARLTGEQDPAADVQRSAGLDPQKIQAGNNAIAQVIAQAGSNNSQFTYDPFGRIVKIVETRSGSVTSTKQFVWVNNELCEERDGSGILTKQFFGYGQTIGGTPYFYTRDHENSVREMTDSSGNVVAAYSYTPDGRVTKLQGSTVDSDFGYAGMYVHQPSRLNLAVHRAYYPVLDRWLSRDPLGEGAGNNLYAYVANNPISYTDPLGLQLGFHSGEWTGRGWSAGTYDTGGENGDYMPMLPSDPGFVGPPSCIDKCAWIHDICMHVGHTIPDARPRRCWNRDCHRNASRCFANCGGVSGRFMAGVFGGLAHFGGAGAYNPNISFPGGDMPPPEGAPYPLR
jgi:RHS repeat-associated protein